MSRAFVREPESADPRCPGCGGLGDEVGPATLRAHLTPADADAVGGRAFYCAGPSCPTAYFTAWGASVPRERMTGTSFPKDPGGPICPCFGIAAADVVRDAREGRKERVRGLVERSRGPEARCAEKSPDGKPCVARVLQVFRESFGGP
jgi:hypothetical protein